MSQYTGKWYKQTEDGYDMVNIIEVSDGLARAIGKNIPIDELLSQYIPEDKMDIGNPFAGNLGISPELVDPSLIQDDVIKDENHAMNQSSQDIAHEKIQQFQPITQTMNDSIPHQLIRNAIQLSNEPSSITINLSHTFPFNMQKIATVANSMGIDVKIVIDVMMNHIKQNPEELFASIEKSFYNQLVTS